MRSFPSVWCISTLKLKDNQALEYLGESFLILRKNKKGGPYRNSCFSLYRKPSNPSFPLLLGGGTVTSATETRDHLDSSNLKSEPFVRA